jgi:hypothetical protein
MGAAETSVSPVDETVVINRARVGTDQPRA